jgi:hypothetical protein
LQSDTLTNALTLTNPIPLIFGITPDNGMDNANTDTTINGSNFVNGLSALLDIFSLTVTFVNSSTLDTNVPGTIMPGGPYTLTISNPGPLTPNNSLTEAFTVTLSSTYGYTPTCINTPDCDDSYGEPDGNPAEIAAGGYLTFTFPVGSGIRNGPQYDFVFFEFPAGSGILLDQIVVEISEDGNSWCQVFNWGDNITDTNSNVADYAAGGEPDNEDIPGSALWPRPSGPNTGIAIDINICPPGGQYRYVLFRNPYPGDAAQVDSIERLH